jgi:hypothetical protein
MKGSSDEEFEDALENLDSLAKLRVLSPTLNGHYGDQTPSTSKVVIKY